MPILRSVIAILAGLVAVIVLSTVTDAALEHSILPQMNTLRVPAPLLALALAYRVLFGVVGGYVTARLAPDRPVGHALVLGAIGAVLGVLGVVAMWSFGNHWYPIALAVLAVPQSWFGAKLAGQRPLV